MGKLFDARILALVGVFAGSSLLALNLAIFRAFSIALTVVL